MLAIYKRELKSYFRSFIGFLFIAVTPLRIPPNFILNTCTEQESIETWQRRDNESM